MPRSHLVPPSYLIAPAPLQRGRRRRSARIHARARTGGNRSRPRCLGNQPGQTPRGGTTRSGSIPGSIDRPIEWLGPGAPPCANVMSPTIEPLKYPGRWATGPPDPGLAIATSTSFASSPNVWPSASFPISKATRSSVRFRATNVSFEGTDRGISRVQEAIGHGDREDHAVRRWRPDFTIGFRRWPFLLRIICRLLVIRRRGRFAGRSSRVATARDREESHHDDDRDLEPPGQDRTVQVSSPADPLASISPFSSARDPT